ncbi:MAG: EAL domain-containing protein [Myxococcota bacterium]
MNDSPSYPAELGVSMALPDPLRGSGRLFLWPKSGGQALRRLAEEAERRFDVYDADGCLAIEVNEDNIVGFLGRLRKGLSEEDLEETRALFKPGLDEPSLSDFPRADSLRTFITFARGKWLGELMSEKRIAVFFQPIVHAGSHEVLGHEALARARSKAGVVGPLRMLSAARDASLLPTFDYAVHEVAFQERANARAEGKLFLNTTPTTASEPDLVLEHVRRLCRLYGTRPADVILEITESEKMSQPDQVERFVTRARDDGFSVALDDLGAGFSNLNMIHRLRPDIVKLDMELTRNIHDDEYKAVIAQKIVELAKTVGIRTVAEGVETEDERDWLEAQGIDYLQGFLFGRPEDLPRDTLDLASTDG